jgi:hypothetical protein
MPNDLLGLTGAGSASLASSQATLGGTHDLPKPDLLLVLVVVPVGVDHVPIPRLIAGPARASTPALAASPRPGRSRRGSRQSSGDFGVHLGRLLRALGRSPRHHLPPETRPWWELGRYSKIARGNRVIIRPAQGDMGMLWIGTQGAPGARSTRGGRTSSNKDRSLRP